MNKIIGALFASITGSISLVHATVLFSPDFNSYATGPLVGQNGWSNNTVYPADQLPLAQNISVSGGKVSLNGSFATPGFFFVQAAMHSISTTPISSGSIFYSASVNFTAADSNAGNAIFLGATTGANNDWGARLGIRSSGDGYQLAWADASTSPEIHWGTALNFGTTYNIVFEYNIVSGVRNNFGSLYVSTGGFNPDQAQNTAYSSGVSGNDPTSFSYLGLFQNNSSGAVTIGDLKVGTTWSDVAAVPEPGTTALLLGASLGTVLLLRRRKIA